MSDNPTTEFMVSLHTVPPQHGFKALVLFTREDREMVREAAKAAGMTLDTFMRTVLVSAAERVLKEAGLRV